MGRNVEETFKKGPDWPAWHDAYGSRTIVGGHHYFTRCDDRVYTFARGNMYWYFFEWERYRYDATTLAIIGLPNESEVRKIMKSLPTWLVLNALS